MTISRTDPFKPWANGNNTYTAIAHDVYGRSSTNSLTVSLNGTNSYTYDLNGNLLSDGTRNFSYDDENELIGVEVASAWSNNFVYDGKMRRRIERDYTWSSGSWILASETHFIYDGNVVVQERNANNLPTVTYTRGNDLSGTLQAAGGIGGLLARTDNSLLLTPNSYLPASALYHSDGNGNVTCLIYTNGLTAAKYLYDPFGNTLAQYGSLANANSYRFSSTEWNANSGLYCYLYRFYDPNLQRWLNQDPLGDDGSLVVMTAGLLPGIDSGNAETLSDDAFLRAWTAINKNLYNYVANNPINEIDPSGLNPAEEMAAALASDDPEQIQLVLDAWGDDMPAALKQAGQNAIKKLNTPCRDLVRGSLKRSPSYHSELENEPYKQIAKDSSNAAKQMRKLINQSERLMQKNK